MNNYEKAKEEGIILFQGSTFAKTEDVLAFLSSFAEKIKEGVEKDREYIVTEIFEESGKTTDGKILYWTKAYRSSDSQTIKE